MRASATALQVPAAVEPGRSAARRRWLGYASFTALAFLISLLATLPLDLLVGRALDAALAGSPLTVRVQSATWSPPFGVRLGQIRATSTRDPALTLEMESLTVRPAVLGVLTAQPESARFDGHIGGGTLAGEIRAGGGQLAVTADLEQVALQALIGGFVPPPGQINGRMDLHVDLAGDGRTTRSTSGVVRGRIVAPALQRARIAGWSVPDLAFRELALDAQIRDGRVQVKELRAPGDELTASATGEVVLRDPLPSSTLALRLTIETGATARPEVRMLAGMLPKRSGPDKAYTLGGTLGAPVLR